MSALRKLLDRLYADKSRTELRINELKLINTFADGSCEPQLVTHEINILSMQLQSVDELIDLTLDCKAA